MLCVCAANGGEERCTGGVGEDGEVVSGGRGVRAANTAVERS